ncbi:MAG: hypothetical protein Q8865_00765 [Bacillota bacterium]|nr:hypothetical protein [Bacillota bacterium]
MYNAAVDAELSTRKDGHDCRHCVKAYESAKTGRNCLNEHLEREQDIIVSKGAT